MLLVVKPLQNISWNIVQTGSDTKLHYRWLYLTFILDGALQLPQLIESLALWAFYLLQLNKIYSQLISCLIHAWKASGTNKRRAMSLTFICSLKLHLGITYQWLWVVITEHLPMSLSGNYFCSIVFYPCWEASWIFASLPVPLYESVHSGPEQSGSNICQFQPQDNQMAVHRILFIGRVFHLYALLLKVN